MTNIPQNPVRLRIVALDVDTTRLHLGGVEALCREARTSADPRVLLDALQVLRLAIAQIAGARS